MYLTENETASNFRRELVVLKKNCYYEERLLRYRVVVFQEPFAVHPMKSLEAFLLNVQHNRQTTVYQKDVEKST
jgi:hypothetical protein